MCCDRLACTEERTVILITVWGGVPETTREMMLYFRPSRAQSLLIVDIYREDIIALALAEQSRTARAELVNIYTICSFSSQRYKEGEKNTIANLHNKKNTNKESLITPRNTLY